MTDPADIAAALARYAYRASDEAALQRALADALTREDIPHRRERVAGSDRYDMWCGGVVVEVKMRGTANALLRQVHRYASRDEVRAVVVATTRRTLLAELPESLADKPVVGVHLRGAM